MRPSSLPANSARREKTPEISSLTNRAHPERTTRGRGLVPAAQFVRVSRACATSLRTVVPAVARRPRAHRSTCRNRPPCRTVPHGVSSSPARDRIGTTPCSGKKAWARVREFPARFSDAGSQAFPLALDTVLGRASEHFDEVIMQAVVELALEAPFETRI